MEVFCRNVPNHLKAHHLKRELTPILDQFDIITFECRVLPGKGHAIITIADAVKARRLLSRYPRGKRLPQHQLLKIHGTIIYLEEGKNEPDQFLLLSLRDEETERRSRPRRPLSTTSDADSQRPRKFYIKSYSCGTFDFKGKKPVFIEQFAMPTSGTINFGPTKLTIAVGCSWDPDKLLKIEVEYWSIYQSIFVSDQNNNLTVTFSCNYAPRLYLAMIKNPMAMSLMMFQRGGPTPREEKKVRLSFLEPEHQHVVSTSFVYRVTLRNPHDRASIWRLAHNPNRPPMLKWNETKQIPSTPYQDQLVRFIITLRQIPFPFAVKFQLQMLAWNGELPMTKVHRLFPYVEQLLVRKSPLVVAKILKALPRRLSHPDPHADSSEVSVENIIAILKEIEELQALESIQPGQPGYLYHNQIEIHRASVTPTGIYLDGPNCEAQNRVLRKFRQHSDYFLRVRFIEESGDPMMYDMSTNLDGIFNKRFHGVLREGIIIADRHYRFLGFSHSSLRSRTCWFMAEFENSIGELITVENLILKLGDFSHIRSPAKFAARLGQTFSDTLTSISIDKDLVTNLDDVERNGRVFSDGCGTISKEILWRIYRDYPRNAAVRPTVFQVRISGAKGMLSLDSTLKGPIICLRDSMIKFQAEEDTNIEICASGIHRLPCYLNAPLIKILEDRGVPRDLFLELQRQEVESLRQTVRSPRQAAIFLDQSHVSKSTRLPWLISTLESIGLHYVHDSFLKRAVELAILMKLRDLKYKSRIIVPKAVTLYGIMDETGILKEGEIFIPILNDQNRREILVHRNVIVTRSPAFHPGDVQLANAVDVPEDCPLRKLHNCVVFSQHGERDLPSQLSGGDLDGDLFNIIYDDRFRLRVPATPADYPRVSGTVLDRPVVIDDIKDFFITFMRQDQLGRIATTHKIIADREALGTFDPKCLTLAELHSTAVDFSKTGMPVDVTKIPKYPPYRPDFMAPGPRVRVAESIDVLEDGNEHLWDDEKNDGHGGPALPDYDEDDDVRPPLRYYRSQRVLGHLYRMIDEKEFMNDLKWETFNESGSVNVLHSLWEYVERETLGFQWDHCIRDAKYFRDIYEENLQDLMYQYSDAPWKNSLTEIEVFVGNIMGQNHKQTAYQKESSRAMRDAYDDLVKWTMSLITGKGTENEVESLERSVACFWVALDKSTTTGTTTRHQSSSAVLPGHKNLRSYAWIAAITCLQEIDKLQRQMPF